MMTRIGEFVDIDLAVLLLIIAFIIFVVYLSDDGSTCTWTIPGKILTCEYHQSSVGGTPTP